MKRDNVLVTADGRAKVLDFGIAKLLHSPSDIETRATAAGAHTDAGIVLGTSGYMSPEQIRGTAVDHRADIFALGEILFEMLSGTRPFAGETSADVMSAVLSRDPAELVMPDGSTPAAIDRRIPALPGEGARSPVPVGARSRVCPRSHHAWNGPRGL